MPTRMWVTQMGAPSGMKSSIAGLGIDTSCYTTSVALAAGGCPVYDGRAPLEVSLGEAGLRQSDAVYQHVRALPGLIEQAFARARDLGLTVITVAASAWPRRVEGSYMPVFNVSLGAGRAVAASLGAGLVEVSHQEGHVAAASYDLAADLPSEHLALHISGGTTELLLVRGAYDIEAIGGTNDLNAGQFIDRVGVALGTGFPAGPDLERLAGSGEKGAVNLPAVGRDMWVSFSGPASAALRAVQAGASGPDVALAVFSCVGRAVGRLAARGMAYTGIHELVVAGGVASNAIVRSVMEREISKAVVGARVHFARADYARDNAVGCALLAYQEACRACEATGGDCR